MNAELASLPPHLRRLLAEARDAVAHDDFGTAAPLFAAAESWLPGDVEVHLYAAWVRARLSHANGGDRHALEDLARDALRGHASLALPLAILGYAALDSGEPRTARGLFQHAVLADPTLLDAKRGLRLAERRLEESLTPRHRMRALLVRGALVVGAAAGVAAVLLDN